MRSRHFLKAIPYVLMVVLVLCCQNARAQDLKVGDPAPEFSTTEAKNFRDHISDFEGKNVVLLGVSFDSQASHQQFKEKYKLPFRLLVDPDKKIAKAYGSSGILFASRDTFVIDGQGKILKIYRSVNPGSHVEELIKGF